MTKAYGASLEDYQRRVTGDATANPNTCAKCHKASAVLHGLCEACILAMDIPHNASAFVYTAADMEARELLIEAQKEVIASLRRRLADADNALLPAHLIAWLKSINAYDEDTPLSEQCKRAVSLAVAAEREAIIKLAESGYRCAGCGAFMLEAESCECKQSRRDKIVISQTDSQTDIDDLCAAIRARSDKQNPTE